MGGAGSIRTKQVNRRSARVVASAPRALFTGKQAGFLMRAGSSPAGDPVTAGWGPVAFAWVCYFARLHGFEAVIKLGPTCEVSNQAKETAYARAFTRGSVPRPGIDRRRLAGRMRRPEGRHDAHVPARPRRALDDDRRPLRHLCHLSKQLVQPAHAGAPEPGRSVRVYQARG